MLLDDGYIEGEIILAYCLWHLQAGSNLNERRPSFIQFKESACWFLLNAIRNERPTGVVSKFAFGKQMQISFAFKEKRPAHDPISTERWWIPRWKFDIFDFAKQNISVAYHPAYFSSIKFNQFITIRDYLMQISN